MNQKRRSGWRANGAGAEETPTYRCEVCGFAYDAADGDAESGIVPGTPFEDIPAAWFCPTCAAPKDSFHAEE